MGHLREHLVYFKVIREQETNVLRGLIYLEEGRQPTMEDFVRCLRECGHKVQLENEKQFIFRAVDDSGKEYWIDVLENYRKSDRDGDAESLSRSFIKQDPQL
ncbi:hypothetical protein FE783_13825 [Paenibacillus mesophilus]|uniref:hypothetical protein n=1 Tax=Paenibacillus mesophilus TaxID=2582849 RepID=UPI00110EEC30|nr:hypothetical protein [Paenibacillus mesophilus]TMV49573.1 hypothetical protein FE783_13825 [Paenibacillus mesophilus]